MSPWLFFALWGPAHAQDAAPTVKAVVFEPAIERLTAILEDKELSFSQPRISVPAACFDAVGVENFNLVIPIETVDVGLEANQTRVRVEFGTIAGRSMRLFARDKPDGDDCEDIDATLQWITFSEGVFEAGLHVEVDQGQLKLDVVDTPLLQGTLDMDIDWVPTWAEGWGGSDWWPDDLILDLIHDDVLALAAQKAADVVPTLVDSFLNTTRIETTVGNLSLAVGLAEIWQKEGALSVEAQVDLGWNGREVCEVPGDVSGPMGEHPDIALATDTGASFGAVVTERLLNHLAYQLWRDGLMCMTAGDIDAIVAEALPALDPAVTGLHAWAKAGSAPRVRFSRRGLAVELRKAELLLTGRDRNQTVTLLDLGLDLDAEVELSMDPDLGAFQVNLAVLELDANVRETHHILRDADDAEAELEGFLERFIPKLAVAKVHDLYIGGRAFPVMDLVAWLDGVEFQNGGVQVMVSLFHAGDPSVDQAPPETEAEIVDADGRALTVAVDGTDDRSSELLYRWRLDDEAWSGWAPGPELEIPDPGPGHYRLEVVARDGWGNADPSPAFLRFDRDEVVTQYGAVPGCSSLGGRSRPLGLAALALCLMGLRSRRRLP